MREIQLEDAKATFFDVVDNALSGEATIIIHRGKRAAVLVSYEEYQRLNSPLGWQLTNAPLDDSDLPVRKPGRSLRSDNFRSLLC
ncbi:MULTISPECIES: type II toxin-antitoxin system Phd/YefM family antitoxin [Rhizobium]|uniref:type II toxin-antitoxin system prevent-host-death family antitoxin n=1 Tax=Rhizobium TaxID=379 RepID=UPI00195A2400|nr:type II toxin-antitoxin system Phd/YefM family antitoxin [Rhizobium lusitanum]MBM7046991.1 type II toxin-antitoxin system Phd/YefM family antitoxin [Rhizobium lusitanum]